MTPEFINRIFQIKDNSDFLEAFSEVFRYQAENNPVYSDFIKRLGIKKETAKIPEEIPFLPVELFKRHKIITGTKSAERIFESSGTTGSSNSRHYIVDTELYEKSFLSSFRCFYRDPEDYIITALLPSYNLRKNSSLIYMMENLIQRSNNPLSGFYQNNTGGMLSNIELGKKEKRKVLLMGVSFALLDLAEQDSPDLSGVIVMETGGMKGRRKEVTRGELHSILTKRLNVSTIHSEYGMTELLSQAYSKGNGIFYCPPWMKIIIRDPQDPLSVIKEPGITGGINIIDLANVHSCSFIATGDLGTLHKDGGFEVLGRFDSSDIRGCNLLIE
ncbi:MAG: acyltransferase [Bacteroidales bacterium]|jgi:phenylacetate-coenzyme A ligase PaaK-like adenylate-forming protein|nr:acyltransferase [Bacteroidales bacterium]